MSGDTLLPILQAAADEEKVWKTTAMASLTVRFADGQFKRSPIAAGDPPMFFKGVRPGKRADYIFEFEPIDSRPFVAIEMDEKQVFKMLPGFEEHIVKAIGYPPETFGSEISFNKARGLFKRDADKREKERLEVLTAAAGAGEAERYKSNPLWGAF